MLITFEGGEGAGKTTQIALLAESLEKEGFKVAAFKEPGSTELGQELRKLLKDVKYSPNKLTELFMFEASRSELVEKEILPKLKKKEIVILDRFYDSSYIYQSLVRGIDEDFVNKCNLMAAHGLVPDLTLVLDVDSELGVFKAIEQSRFEKEGLEFHKQVNEHYRNLPKYFPKRRIIVIPRGSVEEVQKTVYSEVKKIL